MKSVFISSTGASGYIGGDILSELIARYPEHSYRVLVRSQESGQKIQKVYPGIRVIQGDLDNSELLTAESARADIIIHTADAADHLPAARAIAKGPYPDRPVYWLHTSGAGLLSFHDTENKIYGERSEIIYDDLRDIQQILSFPDHAFHKLVDKAVLEAGTVSPTTLRTAVIAPTTVYGKGRGPCFQRSRQVYEMSKFILENCQIPIIGKGQAIGSNIHVHSVTYLFMHFFEVALRGEGDGTIWGPEAYYLVEEGEHCWGELAHSIGEIALKRGFLRNQPKQIALEMDSAQELAGFEATSWAYNMRCRASRARSLLGWQPRGPSLEDELPGIVDEEFERLNGK
ncbi:hypothetical protein N7509_003740 [Penicillium cosmopolitanum]|uniref:NAD-dependent epimerase/dehydratase domain-containing protein n=1 Tax=Penicillium cosmopolitanum TaxID=1131564 RepID=A0A9W9W5G7_9EURO|nr:uncharacterized protein N7509_003740 [Penicillium cosmopolitanum]KAJ5403869.1 hypothetical protein N7509_003740 [Penicillium cosmopolitanum]